MLMKYIIFYSNTTSRQPVVLCLKLGLLPSRNSMSKDSVSRYIFWQKSVEVTELEEISQ